MINCSQMLDIATVVWGEMANSYLEITLPSLLQEGNIPSCHKAISSYTFYASDQAKEVITNDTLYPELEKLVRIFWRPLQRGEWEATSNYLCQMKESASRKSHMLHMAPDQAMGNNSLPNLIKLSGKFKAIFYPSARISEEGYQVLKSLFQAKKVVTNREMVSLLMKYLWKRTYPLVKNGDRWEVSFPLPMPCFLPDAELIDYYSQDRTLTGYNLDHCLPYTMVERDYPWHLIDHSDTFFVVERGRQTLFAKVVERGTFRPEREEDIAKTREAEIFFGKSKLTWQGLSQPVVSIVIACLDMLEVTKKCLESIWANTAPIYELIIVAQAPGNEMLKWLESLKRDNKAEIVIYPKPLGAASALNAGFRKAKRQYIFSISNSLRVTKGWLYPLLDTLKNHPEYGWVCCKEIRGNTVMNFNASALFSREALFKAGLFDEEYSQGVGFDDDDLLRRFWEAGYKPHGCSESIAIHEPEGALAYKKIYDEKERQERFTRNQTLFYQKWGETGTDWNAQPAMPSIDPNDVIQGMHRIGWIRSRVKPEDTILEVGVAENPVWAGTPFKVTTLDRDKGCKPDVVAEVENLPFEPQSFDIVAVGELLEHVPDSQIVLREAARLAKKKVIITVPDEYSWPDEFKPFWNPGHVRFYTYSTFQDELKKLGLPFKIWNVKFQGWSHWCAEIYCDGDKTVKTEQAKEEETMEYPAKLKEFFESERYWHGDWGYRQGYQDFPIHEQVVELIRSRSPKRVLDVGCAMGFIVKRLREKGIDAYGVDISNYAISRAPEEVKPYLQVASAHDLPFPPQSFDLIYCASVLEHIPEDFTDKVIAEFKRVAKGAILGIAYKDPYSALDEHGDISHVNIKDEIWWRKKLPPEFEMIDVCVEDGKPYTRGLTKLNLGCFGDYYPSWINIDILPLRQQLPPHIRFKQADLRGGLPFCADNSVDLVRMSHLIEHLTLEEARNLCHEIHRVLKPGALARISTPDASVIIERYTNQDMSYFNQIQPPEYIQAPTEGERLSRLLFSGDYQHRAVYNFEMLKNFLEQAGFVNIEAVSLGVSRSEVMRNETKDQHVEISLTVEAQKESALPEHPEMKMLTSQPPEGIPDYWKQFATGDRM